MSIKELDLTKLYNELTPFIKYEKNNMDWKKEWVDMPIFYPPTRDTKLRNSYDISEVVDYNRSTPTTLFPKIPHLCHIKGRYEKRLTCDALDKLNIMYKIVIEPQEFTNYSKYISKEKILVLPFSELGKGSIPARNWVWEHAIKSGFKRHWILDDNLGGFGTQKYGRRINTICVIFLRYVKILLTDTPILLWLVLDTDFIIITQNILTF